MMKVWLLTLAGVSLLIGADEAQLALVLKAQSDFDRVQPGAAPQLADARACVQSQAALVPVAPANELALAHYRKGYCTFAGATLTGRPSEFADAAAEFQKAIESWPARPPNSARNTPPEPVSSGLRVMAAIARLKAGIDEQTVNRAYSEIYAAVEGRACPASLMPASFCEAVLQTGRQWAGWIALRRENLFEAARLFSGPPASGWPQWVAGRLAFDAHKYAEAAGKYREAVDAWTRARETSPLIARLGPQPDLASALVDLGGAQLLAGDTARAIATFDAAVKEQPSNAWAIYRRARAKELAGEGEQALADYNLASRTAFANSSDLASGDAHFYRGILLYRRRNVAGAEDEFASALNLDIRADLRGDAEAWRHLAAVAGGSCTASRTYLERALAAVSPYFPKEEARTLMAACAAVTVSTPSGNTFK